MQISRKVAGTVASAAAVIAVGTGIAVAAASGSNDPTQPAAPGSQTAAVPSDAAVSSSAATTSNAAAVAPSTTTSVAAPKRQAAVVVPSQGAPVTDPTPTDPAPTDATSSDATVPDGGSTLIDQGPGVTDEGGVHRAPRPSSHPSDPPTKINLPPAPVEPAPSS